jgi:hypothetical protein
MELFEHQESIFSTSYVETIQPLSNIGQTIMAQHLTI